MIPSCETFHALIKKEIFEDSSGKSYPSTAEIHYHVSGVEQAKVTRMGHLNPEDIYKLIDKGKSLDLDHCYIDKFSLEDYRASRKLDPREVVILKDFSARHSLFGGACNLDFSFSSFTGEVFSLEGTQLAAGGVSFESARFDVKEISFHDTRFAKGYFNFKNTNTGKAEVSFKNCIFGEGSKDFQYAVFGGDVFFINTEFGDGDVNFINAHFSGSKVSYKVARFGRGKVDFHFAAFKDTDLSFERTEFNEGKVDFRTVEFGTRRVNFNRSVFGEGEVVFDECEMESGKFSFKRSTLGNGSFSFEEVMFEHVDVSFERTIFGDNPVSFYKSWFNTLSLSFCHLDGFLDIRVQRSRIVNLSNTVARDIVDMNPHEFSSEVDLLYLGGMRLLGRFYIDWKRNRVSEIINNQDESTWRSRAEQFRILKENFKNLGLYDAEDSAYVEFKRSESKARLKETVSAKPITAIKEYPLYWFKLWFFDRAGLYATSPVRVLLTMISFYLFFSLIFIWMMSSTSADIVASVNDQLSVSARSFYHSAITFLTIGYGDHYPYGAIRWVSAVEGFFGLFLMSYFTVAFVRKILR